MNIDIDNDGLGAIYGAGQKVTLVRSVVSEPLASGNLPIAWLTFKPFQTNNVAWDENYSLYATTTQLKGGATIKMTSSTVTPAQTGVIYTLENGFFTSERGGTADAFHGENQQGDGISFGLAQEATVNNTKVSAPLNAVQVLKNQKVQFVPEEPVSIYLSSYSDNGVVISQVASQALTVTLTSQSPEANIGFDNKTNTFFRKK
ncbi:MAG: hypothetical protein AAFV29_27920 [Myxococcota bacterium]